MSHLNESCRGKPGAVTAPLCNKGVLTVPFPAGGISESRSSRAMSFILTVKHINARWPGEIGH